MIRVDKNPVLSALVGVGVIQAFVGFFGWLSNGPWFTVLDWVITLSFAVFIALGILARWRRVWAALIAAGLYGAFLVWQALISVELLMCGLIFKLPNVILLTIALVCAFTSRSAKPGN